MSPFARAQLQSIVQKLALFVSVCIFAGIHTATVLFLVGYVQAFATIVTILVLATILCLVFGKLRILFGAVLATWTWLRESHLEPMAAILGVVLALTHVDSPLVLLPRFQHDELLHIRVFLLPSSSPGLEIQAGSGYGSFFTILYLCQLLFALGLPSPDLERATKAWVERYMGINLLVIAVPLAVLNATNPQYFYIATPAAAIIFVVNSIFLTRAVAVSMYTNANVARRTNSQIPSGRFWCLHVTDLHITTQGAARADGDSGDNRNIENLVASIAAEPPSFVLVTGDIIDHGHPQEWADAERLFKPLASKQCRILLTPGNHDLSVAYNWNSQYFSVYNGHFRKIPTTFMNGLSLRAYLTRASSLDSDLKDAAGRKLSEVVSAETKQFDDLQRLKAQLDQNLLAKSGLREALIQRFAQQTEEFLPGGRPQMGWKRFGEIRGSNMDVYIGSWYDTHWYDYFPLEFNDNERAITGFILNSVAKDLSLVGSAWGDLGNEQIDRLQNMLSRNESAKSVVILVHHAPFRWYDEALPGLVFDDLERWASLATSKQSSDRLAAVLHEATSRGKDVLLFCGHRHGRMVGTGAIGEWFGGKVAEGASLAKHRDAVIAAWQSPSGRMHLGRANV